MSEHGALRKYCESGGCSAKLGPELLHKILGKLPKLPDPNLIIGFDSSDDAAVYKLSEDIAVVSTLDFFTPMVEDPYTFGKIAAANALSDIYAMGGTVLSALNIVCFPEDMDANILGEILRGGLEKVTESGGVLCGGHSINDSGIKYGLSVTGIVHPDKVLANNGCRIGDKIVLTKPLGVGIVTTAHKIGEAGDEALKKVVTQMESLNRLPAEIMRKYPVSACTDVTGFGFLGHLSEMLRGEEYSIAVDSSCIPYFEEAYACAADFVITASGQRNRNFLGEKVQFENGVSFAMQELLFDPQTSGGLLISLPDEDADRLAKELRKNSLQAAIVAEVTEKTEKYIIVRS